MKNRTPKISMILLTITLELTIIYQNIWRRVLSSVQMNISSSYLFLKYAFDFAIIVRLILGAASIQRLKMARWQEAEL